MSVNSEIYSTYNLYIIENIHANRIRIYSKSKAKQPCRNAIQKSCISTSLKSHPRTDAPPKIHSIPVEPPSPEENLWGTASVCRKSFKRLKL